VPSRHFVFVIGAPGLPAKLAVGAGIAKLSVDVTTARAAINGQDGEPIEITPNQWQFLRGVYGMNPESLPGLPYGDNAVLGQDGGDDSDGQLFFIDCDKPCAQIGFEHRGLHWSARGRTQGRFGIAFAAQRLAAHPVSRRRRRRFSLRRRSLSWQF
jgi:hypothetical protein